MKKMEEFPFYFIVLTFQSVLIMSTILSKFRPVLSIAKRYDTQLTFPRLAILALIQYLLPLLSITLFTYFSFLMWLLPIWQRKIHWPMHSTGMKSGCSISANRITGSTSTVLNSYISVTVSGNRKLKWGGLKSTLLSSTVRMGACAARWKKEYGLISMK